MTDKISIIGAGIGGLTTALALEQRGIEVEVFEQAIAMQPVGAGIILANNAMQVFNQLGLTDELNALGNKISILKITDPQLAPLSTIDLLDFERRYGVNNIAIHRADLQQLLLKKLKQTSVRMGRKLKEVGTSGDQVVLTFEGGDSETVTALIGADGIHSAVRQAVNKEAGIRQARQICWRGVLETQLPLSFRHEFHEAWGKGCRVGFGQINERQVYWFALGNFNSSMEEYAGVNWRDLFKGFHPLVQKLLADTSDQAIYTDEITDLEAIPLWHNNRVCLIGDAAHATTPNMGQGAGQAIEDAWAISQCLTNYPIPKAFEAFQSLRQKKVRQIVNASWSIGKMAQLENRFLIGLRNWILRLTPNVVNRRQLAKVFELEKAG